MKKQLLVIALFASTMAIAQQDSSRTPAGGARGAANPFGGAAARTGPRPYREIITDKAITKKGLFTVHKVDDKYYFEIDDAVLGREILAVTRFTKVPGGGGKYGGEEVNEQSLKFEKGPSNNIFVRVVSLISIADSSNTISRAVKNSYLDPIATALNIAAYGKDSMSYVVEVTDFFKGDNQIVGLDPADKRQFGLGALAADRSYIQNINTFPINTEIRTVKTYTSGGGGGLGAAAPGGGATLRAAQAAGAVTVELNTSMIMLPAKPMARRLFDTRVGFFAGGYTVYSDDQQKVDDQVYAVRWRLEPKPEDMAKYMRGELVEPAKQIVYYIDPATPKQWVKPLIDGINDWQKAFEKAGFKNALQMKIMPDDATWDPADIRYNVIRWVASAQPAYGAIGPSFVNPRTGQIIGADITVEWFSGSATPIFDELYNGAQSEQQQPAMLFPGLNITKYDNCSIAAELKAQYVTGLTTLEIAGAGDAEIKAMHKQFLTYLIMHEMGHTLGLNHNMKSSQMLSPEEINNTSITHSIGLIGSVMDYPAINVSLDRSKQGDYYTTKAGPYDLWAIEYGYTPFSESAEEVGLTNILSRSGDPKLAFGNDGDDMRSPGKGMDPRVNINDLTNDAIGYAEDRFKLVNNLMGKLVQKYTKPGHSYAEVRARYNTLNAQRANMINAVSRYVGGVYVDRTYPEQHSANKPYTPVPLALQKRAMDVMTKYVFAPNAFDADAQVYPYLQLQRRGFNQPGNGEDFRVTNNVLGIQAGGTLAHILNPSTLQRITNTRLYGNQYSVADVMNDLVKGIFDADMNGNVNVYRQYLQTSFVKGTAQLIAPNSPADDVSKASALYTLKKLKTRLAAAPSTNEETKAHRANMIFVIDKAVKTTTE